MIEAGHPASGIYAPREPNGGAPKQCGLGVKMLQESLEVENG